MSFGFSAGDFVACLKLIKDVTQALNNSTGSVSDFKALLLTLKSLENALVTSEVVHLQWEKLHVTPAFKQNATAMTNGIRFEHQQCKLILDKFIKSLTPYIDAFVKGSSMAIVRHARKVTWLFRSEDAGKLDRDLDGHLKALHMYTEALFQIQMASNVQNTGDILSSIIDLRTELATLSKSFQPGTARVPLGLGYPWEASAALADNVLLLDAIGRKVLLPMMLLSSPEDLHDILVVMYRGIHGRKKILRKEYTITDEDTDGSLVDESNWSDAIHQGMQLSLNMVFPASPTLNFQRCPRCDEPTLGNTLPGKRRRCRKCQLTFRVFDKERVFEEADADSESSTSPTSGENGSENQISTACGAKDTSLAPASKSKQNIKSRKEEDFLFKNVHYHREIRIAKTLSDKDNTEDKGKRALKVDELPALHKAAAKGSLAEINSLLDQVMDINAPLPFKVYIFNYILGFNYNLDFNFKGSSPLQVAAWYGKTRAINVLIDRGANINARDSDGAGVLAYAICGESPAKTVLPLLSHGAEIKERQHEGYTSFHYVCRVGLAWLIHPFLERGAGINDKTVSGYSPLHAGAESGSQPVVDILLERGADAMEKDKETGLPLHLAALGGFESISRTLLDQGSDMMAIDSEGDTVLHLACITGHLSLAELLLTRGAEISAKNNDGETPLHKAAWSDNGEVIKLLLQHGADILALDNDKWSPIHCVEDPKAAKILLEGGADVAAVTDIFRTALHMSSRQGHDKVVQVLLRHGASVTARDEDQWTPLHLASSRGHYVSTKLLVEKGADVTAVTDEGETALHLASRMGHESVVRFLLQQGANITARDADLWIPIHSASRNGHRAVVKILLERGASVTAVDDEGRTALHLASEVDDEIVAKLLFEHGADINAKAENGFTPLICACKDGHDGVAKFLLQNGADILAKCADGLTAFLYALESRLDVANLLLDDGADIEKPTSDGWTPLHYAALNGFDRVAKFLLQKGAEVSPVIPSDGRHPIHVATQEGHETIVNILIEKGADINPQTTDGRTPLWWACYQGRGAIAKILLDHGAQQIGDKFGRSPLLEALNLGNEFIAKLLLDHGADPNMTLLTNSVYHIHVMADRNKLALVRLLIQAGADVNVRNEFEQTPLNRVCWYDREDMVKLLLENRGDPSIKDSKGLNALDVARKRNFEGVVRLLEEAMKSG